MLTAAVRLGDNYWLVLGPVIVALALAIGITLAIRASRRSPRPSPDEDAEPHRGDVQGGIIKGDPGQRNRRD